LEEIGARGTIGSTISPHHIERVDIYTMEDLSREALVAAVAAKDALLVGKDAEIRALRTENAALRTKVAAGSASEDKLDDKISFTRILKFQAHGLGYTFLLSLPVLGLAVLASSQELTDWTSSAVPIYAREAYLATTFSLMLGGLAAFYVCLSSTEVGTSIIPHFGTRMALRVALPWTAVSSTVLLATVLGMSWAGVDVHFYHADVVAFVVGAVVICVGTVVLTTKFGPVINPTKYLILGGSEAETEEGKEASDAGGGLIGMLLLIASVIAVIVACKYSTRTQTRSKQCDNRNPRLTCVVCSLRPIPLQQIPSRSSRFTAATPSATGGASCTASWCTPSFSSLFSTGCAKVVPQCTTRGSVALGCPSTNRRCFIARPTSRSVWKPSWC